MNDAVVWHDIECGPYAADLPLWLELAAATGGPILDVGAGTGRVALPLARAGHAVCALDRDQRLLDALAARAGELAISCVPADACDFALDERFALCLVAMQTIALLSDRIAFLRCARAHLRPGGLLAVALLGDGVEPFEVELPPDRTERGGVLYESRPTALRLEAGAVVLERRRERTDATGVRAHDDVIRLAALGPAELAREAAGAGLRLVGARAVEPTDDRAGSLVVILRAPDGRP
jgi:SAM-dependent methyltransferase